MFSDVEFDAEFNGSIRSIASLFVSEICCPQLSFLKLYLRAHRIKNSTDFITPSLPKPIFSFQFCPYSCSDLFFSSSIRFSAHRFTVSVLYFTFFLLTVPSIIKTYEILHFHLSCYSFSSFLFVSIRFSLIDYLILDYSSLIVDPFGVFIFVQVLTDSQTWPPEGGQRDQYLSISSSFLLYRTPWRGSMRGSLCNCHISTMHHYIGFFHISSCIRPIKLSGRG